MECCICFEILKNSKQKKIFICVHTNYHNKCIKSWIDNKNKTCPICRSEQLPTKQYTKKEEKKNYVERLWNHEEEFRNADNREQQRYEKYLRECEQMRINHHQTVSRLNLSRNANKSYWSSGTLQIVNDSNREIRFWSNGNLKYDIDITNNRYIGKIYSSNNDKNTNINYLSSNEIKEIREDWGFIYMGYYN